MIHRRVHERLRATLVLVSLIAAVAAVYCPWPVLAGRAFFDGLDYRALHARRMSFVREALLGPAHSLPAWYPRELMGTPFRADLQNFPWIPTRLASVLLFRPEVAFMATVIASAVLAAIFTYLFARRLGLSRVGAAAAGWTFACLGFYASRILAGHLPFLEAYPALPALLWLIDRALARRADSSLVALAFATASFALAGHPQLTVYSLVVASAYALVCARSFQRSVQPLGAMALGLGLAGFALYPMALLAARSTRILEPGPPSSLALPYRRLATLVFPWRDGWPRSVGREPWMPFAYPNDAYFWDSVCYVGWAPFLAVAVLLVGCLLGRLRPARREWFLAGACAAALFLSLPIAQWLERGPGTFLRAPARWMYVVGFGFSLAFGAVLSRLLNARGARAWRVGLAAVILAAHAADLTLHARPFLRLNPYPQDSASTESLEALRRELGDGRVGIDIFQRAPYNRALDDVGFFAALVLAPSYRFVLDTSGLPPTLHELQLDASQMDERTLRLAGVRWVETTRERPDLVRIAPSAAGTPRYLVRNPSPRAALFPLERVRFKTADEVRALLRDPGFPADATLLLPETARPSAGSEEAAAAPRGASLAADAPVVYRRPSSDEIEVDVATDRLAWVRVLETWDPGWSATLDGRPVDVVPAHGTFVSVAVPAGSHRVRLRYRTPGAWVGVAISGVSLLLLAGLGVWARRRASRDAGGSRGFGTD